MDVLSRLRKGVGVVRLGAVSANEAVAEVTSMADEATITTTRPRTSARSRLAVCPLRRWRLPEGARRGRADGGGGAATVIAEGEKNNADAVISEGQNDRAINTTTL